ncbi:hypothetical protein [Actinomadura macrotermitis]|uniref:Secreted protein n=1 Tax=Actinomadura macrotermitis TaxID=2585200 RepID=A0A7K0C0Q0_9ACTN|nr:hypothetical protein [Actinomadura macrotermitis]MQY07017.1 hypothetical protein [Actinomadura macrotermitis]
MRRTLGRRLSAGAAALTLGGTALSVAAAPAALADSVPTFSFADCPKLPAGADPAFWQCNVAVTTSGTMKLGKLDQAITSPITITYANGFDPVTGVEGAVFGSFKAGRMLVKKGIFGDPFVTAVYAQPKYVGGFGLANGKLQLSLKVSVQNPMLGSYCTIGSNTRPIKLDLGIGTTSPPPPNTPISGSPPEQVTFDPPVMKATVVDNAFAVPGADNCGLDLGLMNATVNLYAGVPAAAGYNTAIFNQYISYKTYDQMPS